MFNVKEQCGAAAAVQLMQSASSFKFLADIQDGDGEGTQVISREMFRTCLSEALRCMGDVLDDNEICQLAAFCFEIIGRPPQPRRSLNSVLSSKSQPSRRSQPPASRGSVCRKEFQQACLLNEDIDLSGMAKLFDADRRQGFLERLFTPRSFPTKRNRMTDPMDAESSRSQGPESETSDVKLQVLTEEMQLVRCELDKLSQSLESLKTQSMKVDNPISWEASLLSKQQKLVELEAQQQTSIQEAVTVATTAALEDMKNMLSAIEKKTTALIQEAVAHATAAAVNHVESMLSAAEAKQQASVQEAVAHATAVAVKDVETTLSAAEAKQQASIQEAVAHATAVVVKDIETKLNAILLELSP